MSRRALRRLVLVAVAVGVVTVVAMVALWPSADIASQVAGTGIDSERFRATVAEAEIDRCSYSSEANPQDCLRLTVRPDQGPHRGEHIALGEYNLADPFVPDLSTGDRVVVGYEPSTDAYFYADQERRGSLVLLFVLFAAAVVLLGRLRGVAALVALGLTVIVLLQFIVPAVLEGTSPLVVALVGASAIAFLSLYLTHGLNSMTTVALLGSLGALSLTALLAWVFFEMARFTGAVSDEATFLPLLAGEVDVRGLLLGGVVIGALGALDDMTVTQASAVYELRATDSHMRPRLLFRRAMRIGRDHVAAIVNTLLLAYVGAAMPLMLLFVLSAQSLGTVANSEVVAVEIVRTLVGSIGLVAAVPLTTGLAAWLVTRPVETDPDPAGAA